MITDDDRKTLNQALGLACERVTGDDVRWKRERKQHIISLMTHVTAGVKPQPTAAELRDALGDPDDRELRRILDAWDSQK
jgi:hypothetical protein